jgi:Holliday junction resolvase-like predicted endonuclease
MTDDEVSAIKKAVKDSKLTGIHIEIGTAAGGTLCEILKFYQDELKVVPPHFIVIDPLTYFENQHKKICRNLQINGLSKNNITFERNKSSVAFRNLSAHAGEIDFILIDGNHKVNHFVGDLRFSRYLKAGGLLLIHDYSKGFKGIHSATNDFLNRYTNYEVLSHVDCLLILRKKSISNSLEISPLNLLSAHFCNLLDQVLNSLRKRFSSNYC